MISREVEIKQYLKTRIDELQKKLNELDNYLKNVLLDESSKIDKLLDSIDKSHEHKKSALKLIIVAEAP